MFWSIQAYTVLAGPALATARPNAKPRRGAPLSSAVMTSLCSVSQPWYDLFMKMFCRIIIWVSNRCQQTSCYCGEHWTMYGCTSTTRN